MDRAKISILFAIDDVDCVIGRMGYIESAGFFVYGCMVKASSLQM